MKLGLKLLWRWLQINNYNWSLMYKLIINEKKVFKNHEVKQFRSNWKYNKIIKNGVFNTSFDEIVCTTRAFSDVIHILESTNTILLDSVWRIEHLRKSLLE